MGKISECIFDIRVPESYMCEDIDIIKKDVSRYHDLAKDCIEENDTEGAISYVDDMKNEMEDGVEKIRSRIENLREWGEEWKKIAKKLFDDLAKIDEETAMNYLTDEAMAVMRGEKYND